MHKDAVHLARLLRLGEVTGVAVPTLEQEQARDLVRAREDCRGDLMRARRRLSKLLLRHGIGYFGGNAWTGKHEQWLRREAGPRLSGATRLAFHADHDAVLTVQARRDRLDKAIAVLAAASESTPVVPRLGRLRGISTLTGFALAVEVRRLAPVHRRLTIYRTIARRPTTRSPHRHPTEETRRSPPPSGTGASPCPLNRT